MTEFPNEIWVAIMELLRPRNLLVAEHVCSRWRELVRDHKLWARWCGWGGLSVVERITPIAKQPYKTCSYHRIFVAQRLVAADFVACLVHLDLIGDGERLFDGGMRVILTKWDHGVVSKRSDRVVYHGSWCKLIVSSAPVVRVFLVNRFGVVAEDEYYYERETKIWELVHHRLYKMGVEPENFIYAPECRGGEKFIGDLVSGAGITIFIDHGSRVHVGTLPPEQFEPYRRGQLAISACIEVLNMFAGRCK
jgi:F-box-like